MFEDNRALVILRPKLCKNELKDKFSKVQVSTNPKGQGLEEKEMYGLAMALINTASTARMTRKKNQTSNVKLDAELINMISKR